MGLTPKTFAEHLGLHPNRFYSFFGNPHTKLRPYIQIANEAGISLDLLATILKENQFGELVESLQTKTATKSIPALAKALAVSDQFIYQRVKNRGLSGLGAYLEMAQTLHWSLDRLAKVCSK